MTKKRVKPNSRNSAASPFSSKAPTSKAVSPPKKGGSRAGAVVGVRSKSKGKTKAQVERLAAVKGVKLGSKKGARKR